VQAVPLTLRAANEFVRQHHRHNAPVTGCRFAVGCQVDGVLVGVAIAGRPVARRLDDGETLEILRVCTDGAANACSFLYARVGRIARLMGYRGVLTYTLADESRASLRAVGARVVGEVPAGEWSKPSRPRRSQPVYGLPKLRWEL
jgi:hypothetical protein